MKRYIGPIVFLLCLCAAAWIFWTRTHTPLGAQVQGAVLEQGYLRGTLVNTGEQTLQSSDLTVTFKDASGNNLGVGTAEYGELKPGASLPVQVQAPAAATSYTVGVESHSGAL